MSIKDSEQIELNLKPKKIIQGIFNECSIIEPPTNNQIILDLFNIKTKNLSEFTNQPLTEISTDIRAVLARTHKTIFIHDQFVHQENRRNFSIFHEIAHFVLPEHKKILNSCTWRDLSPATKKRFEIEANRFAADCIFQLDRFSEEANDYSLSLKTPYTLASKYGASYEATFRHYIENNPLPCAMIVYKPESFDDDPDALVVNYTVKSKSFSDFGYLIPNQKVGADTVESYIFKNRTNGAPDFNPSSLKVNNPLTGKADEYPAESFTNYYKVFQLVLPKGSKLI